MSDDLEGLQPNPDGIEAEGPGEDTTTAETTTETAKIDIFTDPRVRNMQSSLQRETATERAARLKAEGEAASLRAQLGAVLETIQQDPDQAQTTAQRLEAIALKGRLEATERENEQLKREQQNREAREYWTQQAQEAGMDPTSEEFREAWDEAVQEASPAPLKMAIKLHKALKGVRRPPAEPQEETVTAKKPAPTGYTPPPVGGARKVMTEADKAAANQRLQDLYRAPTGHDAEIKQLEKLLGL